MDLFRRKQKLIFWIVTIIIVPSFVLVWGVDRFGQGGTNAYNVGTVNGQEVGYPEFEGFQKRIRAALGGLPLQFAGAPGVGTRSEEYYKYIFALSLLRDAEAAGFAASDLQVGTYLRNGHPGIAATASADAQARERAVDDICRQMQISRPEFLRGVREWQTIGNYLQADAGLTAVNDETVYSFYSLNKAEVAIKRIRFPDSPAVRERASGEIMAMPTDELDAAVRDYAAAHSDRPAYREPALWRFAYVLTPFVAPDSVMQPGEAEIRDRYEQGKSYLYEDKPLSEVRDRIVSELLNAEVERQTMRNFNVDVDPQLRGKNRDLGLDELVKLTQLVKYGVTAGESGPTALPAAEAVKLLPEGTDFQLPTLLANIDGERNVAARDTIIEEWKAGFDLGGRPLRSEKGYFRLRLLDYTPSVPADINGQDGRIRPAIRESALADMISERAYEIIHAEAEAFEARLRQHFIAKEDGQEIPDAELAGQFEALPSETVSYLEIADSNYALGRLPIGDMTSPGYYRDPETGETGEEIIVMADRRVPDRATFDAEPESVKNEFRQIAGSNYRGNFGFTFTMHGPAAVIQPSPAIMGGLADRFTKGQISVNPELISSTEG